MHAYNFVGCPCDCKMDLEVASKHIGQLADSMKEWKGAIAEGLNLTEADIAAVDLEYQNKLRLQM